MDETDHMTFENGCQIFGRLQILSKLLSKWVFNHNIKTELQTQYQSQKLHRVWDKGVFKSVYTFSSQEVLGPSCASLDSRIFGHVFISFFANSSKTKKLENFPFEM